VIGSRRRYGKWEKIAITAKIAKIAEIENFKSVRCRLRRWRRPGEERKPKPFAADPKKKSKTTDKQGLEKIAITAMIAKDRRD
jgi:hypothetical protein